MPSCSWIAFFSFRQTSFPLSLQALSYSYIAQDSLPSSLKQSPFQDIDRASLESLSKAWSNASIACSTSLFRSRAAPLLWQLMGFLGYNQIALLWHSRALSQSFTAQQPAPKFLWQAGMLRLIATACEIAFILSGCLPSFPRALPLQCQNSLSSPNSSPISQLRMTSYHLLRDRQALALQRQVSLSLGRELASSSMPLQSFLSLRSLILVIFSLEPFFIDLIASHSSNSMSFPLILLSQQFTRPKSLTVHNIIVASDQCRFTLARTEFKVILSKQESNILQLILGTDLEVKVGFVQLGPFKTQIYDIELLISRWLQFSFGLMQEDGPPQLDDFQDQIKQINKQAKPGQVGASTSTDYTIPNTRHLQDSEVKEHMIQQINQEVSDIQKSIGTSKSVQGKDSFCGVKKGFFSSQPESKKQRVIEVKPAQKGKNPLEIKQVQDAMKVNNYLNDTRGQWMNNDFLDNVQTNQKISKLFSNPEYMQAIDMFQKNPQQAMAKYGHNKQLMDCFQEFCKMMGTQFTKLAQESKTPK